MRHHAFRALRFSPPLIAILFYGFAAALSTIRLGDHPPFLHNWEAYTARDFWLFWDGNVSFTDLFDVVDGVITDSGRSPIVALPIWLSFHAWGAGFEALRLPLALVCAAAVPLLWLVGRRFVGSAAAALAAALLALSPVFLLYARTATSVGVSMLFVVAAGGVLLRVARPDDGARITRAYVAWIATLQVVLIAGTYAYAPIRLLWPLSLLVLGVELMLVAGGGRLTLAVALAATACALPLALMVAYPNESGLGARFHRYYGVRGEQLLNMGAPYSAFIRGEVPPAASQSQLRLRLIEQNASDYANLLLDRRTLPTLTDFWNYRGRLHSRLLVPFLALGLAVTAWRIRQPEARVLLIVTAGLTAPILLTTHVDVGRLAPTVPLYALFTALGFVEAVRWLSQRAEAVLRGHVKQTPRSWAGRVGVSLAVLGILAASARAAWVNYGIRLGPSREARIEQFLRQKQSAAEAAGGLVLVERDAEGAGLSVSGYRIALGDSYVFVDVNHDLDRPELLTRGPADTRPRFVFGDVLDPARLSRVTDACGYVYYVNPSMEETFEGTERALARECGHAIRYALLPE